MQEYRPYRAPPRLPYHFIILMRLPLLEGQDNCIEQDSYDILPNEYVVLISVSTRKYFCKYIVLISVSTRT